MAQRDLVNRSLDAGKEVGQRTQDHLDSLVGELQRRSEEQAAQARSLLQEAMERSRSASEQIVTTVDRELRHQIANMGLATQADVRRLERKIDGLRGAATAKKAAKKRSAKKGTAKKSAAKKSAKRTAKKQGSTSGTRGTSARRGR